MAPAAPRPLSRVPAVWGLGPDRADAEWPAGHGGARRPDLCRGVAREHAPARHASEPGLSAAPVCTRGEVCALMVPSTAELRCSCRTARREARLRGGQQRLTPG